MTNSGSIQSTLQETRKFLPASEFSAQAHISSEEQYQSMWQKAKDDPAGFWGELSQELQWITPWKEVISGEMPETRWFTGGQINACENCVDRHLTSWRRNKAAILWEGEPGDTRVLTYNDLHREVSKFANVLKKTGCQHG